MRGHFRPQLQETSQKSAKPEITMARPKNRIWPSCNFKSCSNKARQPPGETMGISPSKMSISARASQRVSDKVHFRAGALPAAPRMALKKSELAGSSTITSLLLAMVVL